MSIYAGIFLWFCAFVAVVLLAGWRQHVNHRAPQPQPQPPARPRRTCHVRGCGRLAHHQIVRRDTLTPEWVCIGCRDQGYILGYWLPEAAA